MHFLPRLLLSNRRYVFSLGGLARYLSTAGGGWGDLHLAAATGNLDLVKSLLEQGYDVNERIMDRSTPLHLAAANGWVLVIEHLVENGASLNAVDASGLTPLQTALRNRQQKCVQSLSGWKARCANADKITPPATFRDMSPHDDSVQSGETAVHVAAESKNEDVLREIINFVGPSAADIEYSVIIEKCGALEDLLILRDKAGRSVKDMPGAADILAAILRGRAYALDVKRFVRAKYPQLSLMNPNKERIPVNINCRDEVIHGATPLHYVATSCDALPLMDMLIAHGANVNAQSDACGETPLHWAVKSSSDAHFAMVKALLAAGADATMQTFRPTGQRRMILPDIQLSAGSTPIHYAVRLRKYNVFALIVDHVRPSEADCDPAVRDAKSQAFEELVAIKDCEGRSVNDLLR
ncbi:ankyrin repeat domain containing protein [Perkinsus marinus ATCC 50983]|uniref:Ankyrin repeat domain containing protein n=1 Tax=Perkinsus marinus (strain ATCC 50983 / TXsc) TaxID=423536 RepID=C5KQ43_PERM5|nr:ankyrin repeat domain containing protein [Perkinsus marinus ATCC 50983]EER13398.1 ankyrin repeat domain containing protein [Perkinsus marinus ATCC 50983]|eukprot:XP_002781603.1 ankyrin repeat domain containing protein [Perkinsus marinus ATCC 50983]